MKKNIFVVVHILLIGLTSFAQDNVFLERTFWKTNPSVETIDQKIKEGHNPSQPNSNNFDPVVYAILE
ncbi:MAG: ankyrin repeat domain-containing protein, partial [Mangrovimonas sp.]|nr:ankyrin repeat domain-containing protein [Mangrovimonas sp.]